MNLTILRTIANELKLGILMSREDGDCTIDLENALDVIELQIAVMMKQKTVILKAA